MFQQEISECLDSQDFEFSIASKDISNSQVRILFNIQSTNSLWIRVKSLILLDNKISYQGIGHLTKVQWIQLESIDLSSNQLGNEGLKYLSKAYFPCLHTIQLSHNSIRDEGLSHFSSIRWQKISDIYLNSNCFDKRNAEKYILSSGIKSVQRIYAQSGELIFFEENIDEIENDL